MQHADEETAITADSSAEKPSSRSGLTVSDAANILGVTRQALSLLLNERTDLSSEMALRMEKAFGLKMDHLMRMQLVFDVSKQRERENTIKVKRYQPA